MGDGVILGVLLSVGVASFTAFAVYALTRGELAAVSSACAQLAELARQQQQTIAQQANVIAEYIAEGEATAEDLGL